MAWIYFARTDAAWLGDGLSPETAFRLRRTPDRGMISFCPPGQGDPTSWPVLAAFSTRQPAAWDDYLFANDIDQPLSAALATKLENRFNVTLNERTGLRTVLRELFIDHARSDGTRWAPLQPSRIPGGGGRQYEIWVGGQLISAWPYVGGGATVFTDDFNRADSTTIGGNWTERLNDAQIKNNHLSGISIGQEVLVDNSGAIGSANYQVEANVVIGAGTGACGVTGRVAAASPTLNFYLLELEHSTQQVASYRRVQSNYTLLGTPYAVGANSAKIKLSMNGSTLKAYVNDVERDSFTDSLHSAEGDFGIRIFDGADLSQVDNYVVYDFSVAGPPRPMIMRQAVMRAATR